MKQIIFYLLFLLVSATNVFAQTRSKPEPRFNPTGFLYNNEIPELFPRKKGYDVRGDAGTERVEIELKTASLKSRHNRSSKYFSVPPEGMFKVPGDFTVTGVFKLPTNYKLTNISLKGFHFSFETETIDGVSYTFTGRFLRGGIYYRSAPKGIVLQGQLGRIRNRKLEAEAKVAFGWYGGD